MSSLIIIIDIFHTYIGCLGLHRELNHLVLLYFGRIFYDRILNQAVFK